MSRTTGEFIITSNYEVAARKPFDARSLVKSYEHLLLVDSWTVNNKINAYNGMIVAVANTSDVSKNGLYMLFDPNNTSSLKAPDVTVSTNWIKIGETSDVSEFASRIETIEKKLKDITDDMTELDSRVTALETEERVHVVGYRHKFPADGEEGHMYIANDEGCTYVFTKGKYYHIADRILTFEDNDNDPETDDLRIIYGGDAN